MSEQANLEIDQVVPKLQVCEDGDWITSFPEMKQILSEAQLPSYPLDRVAGLIVVRSFSRMGGRQLTISQVYAVRAGDTDKYDNCYLLYDESIGFRSPALHQDFYAPDMNLRTLLQEQPPQPLDTADPEAFLWLRASMQAWVEAYKSGETDLSAYEAQIMYDASMVVYGAQGHPQTPFKNNPKGS